MVHLNKKGGKVLPPFCLCFDNKFFYHSHDERFCLQMDLSTRLVFQTGLLTSCPGQNRAALVAMGNARNGESFYSFISIIKAYRFYFKNNIKELGPLFKNVTISHKLSRSSVACLSSADFIFHFQTVPLVFCKTGYCL
jgi:hypothetical protein